MRFKKRDAEFALKAASVRTTVGSEHVERIGGAVRLPVSTIRTKVCHCPELVHARILLHKMK